MIELCLLLILASPFIYYGVAINYYLKNKEARTFLQLVVFPLPAMVFISFLLYELFKSPGHYDKLINILIWITVPIGLGIIVHAIFEKDLSRFSFLTRIPSALILMFIPFLIFEPDLFEMIAPWAFAVAGALMGIYGYVKFYKGKKIGLLYGYLAIFFFVAAPLICMAISIAYFEIAKDNVIYRRSSWGSESCHDVAFPIFILEEGFIKPLLFSAGYLGLMGIVAGIRKKTLEKELRKEGLIPEEFDKVLKAKEKDYE